MLKDKSIGQRIVPILADEARTFGMEGLFRQIGISSPHGQQYTLQDRDIVSLLSGKTSRVRFCKTVSTSWVPCPPGWLLRPLTAPTTAR